MYPPCRAAGKRRLSSVYHYIKGYREKQFLSFPSAEGKRFRRYSGLPLEATLRPRRAWTVAAFGGREMPPPGGGGKRGQGHRMVPLPPLDSPKPSFAPRLPLVARLNARGPQGRLVLQEHDFDRSGALRSTRQTPCTVWPRTVMRGKSRKLTSGPDSVPKFARRTEPSPRTPRFAAHLRCVSAKEGKGSQEGTGNHTWCPVPSCSRR